MGSWNHWEHRADIGVEGRGADLAEAFAQAALALTAVITEPSGVAERSSIDVACAAADAQALLVEWLEALVFEMAVRRTVFGRFEVQVDEDPSGGAERWGLVATVWGEPVDVARHAPAVEVKGVTWHGLVVARAGDEWVARAVVDV